MRALNARQPRSKRRPASAKTFLNANGCEQVRPSVWRKASQTRALLIKGLQSCAEAVETTGGFRKIVDVTGALVLTKVS